MADRWKIMRDRVARAIFDHVEGEAAVDAALAALDMEANLLRAELRCVEDMRAILATKAGRTPPTATASGGGWAPS